MECILKYRPIAIIMKYYIHQYDVKIYAIYIAACVYKTMKINF